MELECGIALANSISSYMELSDGRGKRRHSGNFAFQFEIDEVGPFMGIYAPPLKWAHFSLPTFERTGGELEIDEATARAMFVACAAEELENNKGVYVPEAYAIMVRDVNAALNASK